MHNDNKPLATHAGAAPAQAVAEQRAALQARVQAVRAAGVLPADKAPAAAASDWGNWKNG